MGDIFGWIVLLILPGLHRLLRSAALGPTIRQPNYEVGPELADRLLADDAANARFFAPSRREGHTVFDLSGYIGLRARDAGLVNFEDLERCTYAEPERFFSYRRATHRGESDYGRHINAIVLRN